MSAAAAPTPIFIHGAGCDHTIWAGQRGCFAGALAVDLPGHGGDDAPPMADAAALAAALAPAIGAAPGPRVLVGHSLGGAVALHLALAAPELVDGLVLITTGARLPVPQRHLAALGSNFEAECARLLDGFFARPDRAAVAVGHTLANLGAAVLRADYAACRSHDLRGRLGAVRAPCLVIGAREDPLTPFWMSEELARELPQAQLVAIEEMRHMAVVEAAPTVNLFIAAHLARLEL